MAFEHILFDLDGTLTDSYEGIANACSMPFTITALKKTTKKI